MKPKTEKWFEKNSWWIIVLSLILMYGGLLVAMIWIY